MSAEEVSIVINRMKTLVDLYTRNTTITDLVKKTGIKYDLIQKVLSANNYYHGIKLTEGRPNHQISPFIFYKDFEFLLNYPILDSLRV